MLEQIKEAGIPVITIGDMELPLAHGPGMNRHIWALLNLILAIAGAILAVILVIRVFIRKRGESEYSDGDADTYDDYEDEEEEKKKRRFFWIVITIIMGVTGLVVFFLTEDMTKLMVLVDY